MRILTSGVYIHGLRHWGQQFPAAQLHLVRSEDLFEQTRETMARVQAFLGLRRFLPRSVLGTVHNRNPSKKSLATRSLNRTLDEFFAPYNEQLYEWLQQRGIPFERWQNASGSIAQNVGV